MMELYPKQKSDAEYILWIRKQVAHAKRSAVFHGVMFFVFIALYLVLNHLVFQFHEFMPEIAETLPVGIVIGVQFGVMFVFLGGMAAFCVFMAIRHLKGNRTETLMLKFHDELKKKEGFQQGCSTVSSEGAPSEDP